jgi:hypothetical protein
MNEPVSRSRIVVYERRESVQNRWYRNDLAVAHLMTACGMTRAVSREVGTAARLSDGSTELCQDAEGACQDDRPWPEPGTHSDSDAGAKAEAARGKEEGGLSLVTAAGTPGSRRYSTLVWLTPGRTGMSWRWPWSSSTGTEWRRGSQPDRLGLRPVRACRNLFCPSPVAARVRFDRT